MLRIRRVAAAAAAAETTTQLSHSGTPPLTPAARAATLVPAPAGLEPSVSQTLRHVLPGSAFAFWAPFFACISSLGLRHIHHSRLASPDVTLVF